MFEWKVGKSEVMEVLRKGDVIAEYPGDQLPWPSRLLLGFTGSDPLHVVAAVDPANRVCHLLTVYRPDQEVWGPGFRARRLP